MEKALWKDIICSKYKYDPKSWLPSTDSQISCSRVWTDILSIVVSKHFFFDFLHSHIRIELGDGNRCSFWNDSWTSAGCLKLAFPRLFMLSQDKEASVIVILSNRSSPNGWEFNFRRRLYSWESVDLSNLIILLNSGPVLRSGVKDKLVWTFSASEVYSVKLAYEWISCTVSPSVLVPSLLWKGISPPKMQFICWLAWRGRLKTSVFLQNIGALDPSGSSLCCFCNSYAEDVSHALLHCQFAWRIWSDLVEWWSLVWVVPVNVSQLLDW